MLQTVLVCTQSASNGRNEFNGRLHLGNGSFRSICSPYVNFINTHIFQRNCRNADGQRLSFVGTNLHIQRSCTGTIDCQLRKRLCFGSVRRRDTENHLKIVFAGNDHSVVLITYRCICRESRTSCYCRRTHCSNISLGIESNIQRIQYIFLCLHLVGVILYFYIIIVGISLPIKGTV